MAKRIILLDHTAAHYRRDLFTLLLNNRDFQFEIVAGKNYDGVKCLEGNYVLLDYKKIKLFNHTFYYLKGILKFFNSKKVDIIICTGFDPHMIHTLIQFILHRLIFRKSFFWWSHATIGKQGYIGLFFRKFIYKKSSGILVYNNQGRDNLISFGIPKEKIKVVNNSVNLNEYGYVSSNNLIFNNREKKLLNILFCGRITENKKIEVLIRALSIIKTKKLFPFSCKIVGEGSYSDFLLNLSKQENVQDEIEFVGEKYEEEITPFFLNADLFIYPGGIGLSILHALSFGLPVLTTDNMASHGPEIELLSPGNNGDFCKDESVDDFVAKIILWENKLKVNQNIIQHNCINSVKNSDYLPEIMYKKIIDFINQNNK